MNRTPVVIEEIIPSIWLKKEINFYSMKTNKSLWRLIEYGEKVVFDWILDLNNTKGYSRREIHTRSRYTKNFPPYISCWWDRTKFDFTERDNYYCSLSKLNCCPPHRRPAITSNPPSPSKYATPSTISHLRKPRKAAATARYLRLTCLVYFPLKSIKCFCLRNQRSL